jgi:RimJ/RimL family protein N-acetyltransferase
MLINPSPNYFEELARNCFLNQGDMDHLNRYPYGNLRPTPQQLSGFLRAAPQKWLVQEGGIIVGFFVYGNFIPHQPHAFGMGIGQGYVRRGFARRALREFIERRAEFSVEEINGYCSRHNHAMIGLMNEMGFILNPEFKDLIDPNAVKYNLQL